MFAIWLADKIAPKIGKKEDSIENIKLPGFLQMFSDNVVSTSVLMFIFFGIIMLVLGEDFMRSLDDTFSQTTAFGFYIFSKALSFTVYLNVLQAGVRMFVAELTESFKGISDKLLPGAIPAVDCAVAYGFAPANAVTVGFFCGALGQFLAIAGLLIFHSPVMIIAGFVPLFFDNASIAVYANHRGGVKAAMILPFISGIIQVLGGAVCAYILQLVAFGGWHGNFDFSTIFLAVSYIVKYLKVPGVILCVIAMLVIPQIQYAKSDKEKYFTVGQEDDESTKKAISNQFLIKQSISQNSGGIYYENQSNRSMWKWNGIKSDDQNEDQQSIQKIRIDAEIGHMSVGEAKGVANNYDMIFVSETFTSQFRTGKRYKSHWT